MITTENSYDIKHFSKSSPKDEVLAIAEEFVTKNGFSVVAKDDNRPWGGFLVLDESKAFDFISFFFPNLSPKDFEGYEKLSPKILIVAPEKRLSWQYHERRAEIWKLIGGEAGVVRSETDDLREVEELGMGQIVNLKQGERHRLVGLQNYGLVAEIWEHTDPSRPSDEEDIIRVSDDFGR